VSCCDNNKSIESKCVSTEDCWIERPKYFKGQLLTDADLTAEQKYVIEKNKLHNRYLHGWGVVCGLKVKCFPCCTGHGASGKVLVEPGYAIDCCGNDIIICNEVEYDVVKRINEFKKKKKAEADPCSGETVEEETTCECKSGGEKYYVVLQYKEADSKPATALNTQDACSIQSCVPSRTEECYKLDLVEYCTLNRTMEERFLTKVKKCLELFTNTWQKVFGDKGTDVTKQSVTEDQLKTFIKEYHKVLPSHINCDILDELDAIETTEGESEKEHLFDYEPPIRLTATGASPLLAIQAKLKSDYNASDNLTSTPINESTLEITDSTNNVVYSVEKESQKEIYHVYRITESTGKLAIVQLYIMIFGLLLECICQALLRPCPECGEDDIVILAAVTVDGKKIDSICNFERKIVMTFPTLFYYLPLDVGFEKMTKFICCDFVDFLANVFQGVQYPTYKFAAMATKNNFAAPKMMSANFVKAFKVVPQSMFRVFDPTNVSLENSLNKDAVQAKSDLKKLNVTVVGTEKYEPSLADFSLERIISTVPIARPGSKVVLLVDDNNKVVNFRMSEEAQTVTPGEKVKETADIGEVKKELDELRSNIATMKTQMKRDTSTVIETRVPIEKSYRSLTKELTGSLLKEIPSETLKDVGDVRAGEMKKVNIESVHDVLEAVPATVSDAVNEPMSSAVKYVDNAEDYAVEVAKLVAEELKAKGIKKTSDLDKIDTKKIANNLKISEKVVKRSIDNLKQ
jgi:hypothetical protein